MPTNIAQCPSCQCNETRTYYDTDEKGETQVTNITCKNCGTPIDITTQAPTGETKTKQEEK